MAFKAWPSFCWKKPLWFWKNHRLFQQKDMLDCGRTAHGCVGGSERAFQFLNKEREFFKKIEPQKFKSLRLFEVPKKQSQIFALAQSHFFTPRDTAKTIFLHFHFPYLFHEKTYNLLLFENIVSHNKKHTIFIRVSFLQEALFSKKHSTRERWAQWEPLPQKQAEPPRKPPTPNPDLSTQNEFVLNVGKSILRL